MQNAELNWQDGLVPVATRFGDSYYSRRGGLAEKRHVFLDGNDLPQRFRPGFRIAELGFGTGLSALAAWECWDRSGRQGVLHFTSFEAFPMRPGDMALALSAWPDLAGRAAALVAQWASGAPLMVLDTLHLRVIRGPALTGLAAWDGQADAWFLDGFSPAANPDMWSDDLMMQVARHSRQGTTLATYSAAGRVRRALAQAGFDVSRHAGYAGKKHMTRGILK